MTLKSKYAAVRKYSNFQKILNDIIKDNEKEILALNRDQMWEQGITDVNNPNSILQYAPSTIQSKKKRAKYKRTDHITLKWTGDFHKGMFLKIEPDQFTIMSKNVPYQGFMEGRFGNALGLTAESKNELRKLIKNDLILGYKNAVQNA